MTTSADDWQLVLELKSFVGEGVVKETDRALLKRVRRKICKVVFVNATAISAPLRATEVKNNAQINATVAKIVHRATVRVLSPQDLKDMGENSDPAS